MKRFGWLVLTWLLPLAGLRAGPWTAPIYINSGNVTYTNPPQVDATAFLNLGNFVVASELPYDFQNTLYYTNRGTMGAAVGFRFDYTDDFGIRRPAARFQNSGVIEAFEGFFNIGYSNLYSPTHLFVRATNVSNPGTLTVGNAGLLSITGQAVDLSRGGYEVIPIEGFPFANNIYDTNDDNIPDAFDPDNAIYDLYWGTGIQDPPPFGPANSANILRFLGGGVLASSPSHAVTNRGAWGFTSVSTFVPVEYNTTFAYTGIVGGVGLVLTNFDGSLSNIFMPTNIYRQAVVVGVSDTNLQVRTKFNTFFSQTAFNSVLVELRSLTTNVVSGRPETNAIYFVDRLAAETNLLTLTNLGVLFPTARPIAYEVWRSDPLGGEFQLSANGNSELFRTILYDRSYSNIFVTNFYAGYSCAVDYLQSRAPRVPGAEATNQPGRIEINADTVDLSRARLRGMGAINIKTRHLKTSAGAAVDCENLVYDLTSTNGLLTVQSLSKDSVDRMFGTLYAWSGLWTNQTEMILSNWFIDATTNYFSPLTNAIDIGMHILILSADEMTRTQEVVTHTLTLHSTNVVVDDPITVNRSLILDAQNVTLNGRLTLRSPLDNWEATNAPYLLAFTNTGTIRVPNIANYGGGYADGRRWQQFVNRGTLYALGHRIEADVYDDGGSIYSDSDMTLSVGTARMEGGINVSQGDVRLMANDLKLRNHSITASRSLFISVTNSLTDAGDDSRNTIATTEGFHLLRRPNIGDLLGTTFEAGAPEFASILHTWAGDDRGALPAGYSNNVAIGRLVLAVLESSELRFAKPNDANGVPVDGEYALYVDYLELGAGFAGDPELSRLVIEPGFTIYFAISNVPAEQLDGKKDGQLRWVSKYAGPASAWPVAVRMGGDAVKTIIVNKALLDSATIDSDGDGLANAYDDWPFDGPMIVDLSVAETMPFTTELSWDAAAKTVYTVEYATNVVKALWQPLTTVTNDSDTGQVLTIRDTVNSGGRERYYRVHYSP